MTVSALSPYNPPGRTLLRAICSQTLERNASWAKLQHFLTPTSVPRSHLSLRHTPNYGIRRIAYDSSCLFHSLEPLSSLRLEEV